MEQLEGKRRADIEAGLVKHDSKMNKIHQRHDTPAAVAHMAAMSAIDATRRRSKLSLPAPQMSEEELEVRVCGSLPLIF